MSFQGAEMGKIHCIHDAYHYTMDTAPSSAMVES